MGIKEDCFGCRNSICAVLEKTDCDGCNFYATRERARLDREHAKGILLAKGLVPQMKILSDGKVIMTTRKI